MNQKLFQGIFVAATVALCAACGAPSVSDLGGGSGDDSSSTPQPTPTPGQPGMTLSFDSATASSLDFDATTTISFHVTPANGFTGTVAISLATTASGLHGADGVQVDVTDSNPVSGTIDLDTDDLANVVPGVYTGVTLHAASGSITSDITLPALTINPKLILTIRSGIGTGVATDTWGPDNTTGLMLHMGTDSSAMPNTQFVIGWKNLDTVNHTIHADATYAQFGLTHGQTPTDPTGDPGNTQMRTITPMLSQATPSRTFMPGSFYCHTHQSPTSEQSGKLTFLL